MNFTRLVMEDLLAHELGHYFFIAATGSAYDTASAMAGRYATGFPDWFEEAIAMWMEPEQQRASRLRRVRAGADSIPSLLDVTRQVHPWAGRIREGAPVASVSTLEHPCRGECSGEALSEPRRISTLLLEGGAIRTDTTYGARALEGSEDVPDHMTAFYGQSYAAFLFIYEHGGKAAIKELWRRYEADPENAEAVLGLPGLPSDARTLEADWRRWLRAPDPSRTAPSGERP